MNEVVVPEPVTPHIPFDEATLISEYLDSFAIANVSIQKIDQRMVKQLAQYHRLAYEADCYLREIDPIEDTNKFATMGRVRDAAWVMVMRFRRDLNLTVSNRAPQGSLEADFGSLFPNSARNNNPRRKKDMVHAGMA